MSNSQNNTKNINDFNLFDFFTNPKSKRQRQYEVVRAVVIEKLSAESASKKFGLKVNTVYSLIHDAKTGELNLFPEVKMGPKQRKTDTTITEKIITYRKENLSSPDISKKLANEKITVSIRTIERILKEKGFPKLKRRTNKELGITKKNTVIPLRSEIIDFTTLGKFKIDCPSIGVFFFLPYIIESGIVDIIKKCNLPSSKEIDSVNACLSMLVLKLIGSVRLSHMESYDQERGLGLFAGLNVLPKSTYMSTYSCLSSEEMLLNFQQEIIKQFTEVYPDFYSGDYINLDFHSIPHFGEQSEMEKIWCGAKNKTLKGANTVFAQDSNSNAILYTRADILRKDESEEIQRFVDFWKKVRGDVTETLVFDCKFTKYKILNELCNDEIKFITLRKRSDKLINEAFKIPKNKWQRIHLPIPKRKSTRVSVYEDEVMLTGCSHKLRQIIVKDHGREKPTFIITNNRSLPLNVVLEIYSKRWHIENKLSELVSFFNLNALSSPLMIRIHFDIIWTMIADTIYHRFAKDLKRFEKSLAPSIFNKFINMPGIIVYDNNKFQIKIRKRAHTPILLGLKKLKCPIVVPWFDNKTVEIVWTP